jgi:predicted short-subunit dehydrogenase-like oxidoreductase (DUF2520 family)
MFTKIAIIGTGNMGTWLFKTIQNQDNISVISVSGRKIETLPKDFDLYIFALKDDIYEDVLKQIPFKMQCAVHTSGSLSQNILASFAKKYGVLYPYQTINEWRMENGEWRMEVPICVEGSDSIFENALFDWAKSIFNNVYKINEKQRFAMHLAAVFANNFTNAMYGIAYNIFKENDLDWSLIFPLLENTLEKAKHNDPHTVQTGPAVRGDVSIMEKHCDDLNDENLRLLYKTISKIIQPQTNNH